MSKVRLVKERNTLHRLYLGDLEIWYSYETPIAFRGRDMVLVARENDWSNTTGKHMNQIPGNEKKNRIPGEEFEKLLDERLLWMENNF